MEIESTLGEHGTPAKLPTGQPSCAEGLEETHLKPEPMFSAAGKRSEWPNS